MVSLAQLPQSALALFEKLLYLGKQESLDYPWSPPYRPQHLSHVTQIFADGKISIQAIVYLPEDYRSPQTQVQVQVGRTPWQSLSPSVEDPAYWSLNLDELREGQPLRFRYRYREEEAWRPLVPLNDLEGVQGTLYVPKLTYSWENPIPKRRHASVLLETTLEGLLAGYKGGRFAPRSKEEMFQQSIAQRILKTIIPERLRDWSIDELMVPILPSVADRSHLDPKFNYLTFNVADVDWQVASARDLKRLLDRLHKNQITFVPDMIFAHQVRSPYAGSLDQVGDEPDQHHVYVDKEAYLFRDYGTWMINFADPNIRRQVIEKITAFVARYRLEVIRVDYVDGIILQYSKRDPNYGEILLRELKQELRSVCPSVSVLGEAFEAADNPAAQEFIDDYYVPIGFSIVEELYKPPGKMDRPLYPDIEQMIPGLDYATHTDRRMAIYAQLHDETWTDEHILAGRPHVPWAYGGHPAELARRRGEELISMELLTEPDLLDFVRRTVRGVEALTLFSSRLRYMFVSAVDSLSLDSLDAPYQWKVTWDEVTLDQRTYWTGRGIPEEKVIWLHNLHRLQMITLRQIFREHTLIDEASHSPLTQVEICYSDPHQSILGLQRFCPTIPGHTLLVIFNFGPKSFSFERCYELPLSEELMGQWEILFDGDWDLLNGQDQQSPAAYPPGSQIETLPGIYSNQEYVLRLNLGANSLLVLRKLSVGDDD